MTATPASSENKALPLINIFELPSQTALVVFLMSALLLATLAMIAVNSSVPLWPVLLLVVLLSLRRLLRWPEEEVARFNLRLAGECYPILQQRIQTLSRLLDLPCQPVLMLALPTPELRRESPLSKLWSVLGGNFGRGHMSGNEGAGVFGSFKRWYLWMGATYAARLEEMLKHEGGWQRADAILLHELHHFKHGDTMQLGWARAIRETTFWTIGWTLLIGIGYFAILTYAQAEIAANGIESYLTRIFAIVPYLEPIIRSSLPPGDELEQLRTIQPVQFAGLLGHLIANTLPIVLIAIVLLRYWLRFLKLREVYADSGVAHVQRQIAPLMRALVLPAHSAAAPRVWRKRGAGARFHLSAQERLRHLEHPSLLFDTPVRHGLEVGFFLFLFEAIMFGTTALGVTSAFPIHYPALIIFALLGLRMVAEVATAVPSSGARPLWWSLGVMLCLSLIPHAFLLMSSLSFLWLGLLFFPDGLVEVLNGSLRLLTGYTGTSLEGGYTSESLFSDVVLISTGNIAQLLFLIPFSFLMIWFYSKLVSRMLTWYGYYAEGGSLRRLAYWALLVLGLLITFVLLPPVTDLILGRGQNLLSPRPVVLALITLAVSAWSLYRWVRMDRCYGRICPACSFRNEGAYVLDCRCTNCGAALNPRLVSDFYRMESSTPGARTGELALPAGNPPAAGDQDNHRPRRRPNYRLMILSAALCAASPLLVHAENGYLNIAGFILFLLLFPVIFLIAVLHSAYVERPGFWILLGAVLIVSGALLYSPLIVSSSLVSSAAEISLVYGLFVVWVSGALLLFRKDIGSVIFGTTSVILTWSIVIYWRTQGDFLEAAFRAVEGMVDPLYALIVPLLFFATCFLPLSALSLLGHMFLILRRECLSIHPTA